MNFYFECDHLTALIKTLLFRKLEVDRDHFTQRFKDNITFLLVCRKINFTWLYIEWICMCAIKHDGTCRTKVC